MDGLYFLSKAQFHQLATHISLYHEDASPGYRALGEECLRLCGLHPERFAYWHVPGMAGYFGTTVPVDVHGGHVLVDEAAAARVAAHYGVLRYSYLTAAVRAREGGRWRYDFTTMNLALGAGVLSGFAALSAGRRRLSWMRRRPFGAVCAGAAVCLAATVAARQAMRAFGFGVVAAQNSHRAALARLDCADCLDDVRRHSWAQAEELRRQALPQQPGMPPPPQDVVRRFGRAKAAQARLLEADADEVRALQRRVGAARFCAAHEGLRSGGEAFREASQLPLQSADVARAAERAMESNVETAGQGAHTH